MGERAEYEEDLFRNWNSYKRCIKAIMQDDAGNHKEGYGCEDTWFHASLILAAYGIRHTAGVERMVKEICKDLALPYDYDADGCVIDPPEVL